MRVVSTIYTMVLLPLNLTVFSMVSDLITDVRRVDTGWAQFIVVTSLLGIVLGFLAMTDDEILLEMRLHLWCFVPALGILVADGVSSLLWGYAPNWLLVAIAPYG